MSDPETIALEYIEQVWNQRKLDFADTVIAPDYVNHSVGYSGPEGIKEDLANIQAVFPDAHWSVEDSFAHGDRVAVRFVFRGTHQGTFMGIPATAKAVVVPAITIFRVAERRIAEEWVNLDFYGMLRQLGVRITPPANLTPAAK
ncbi:MAG: ester cyclase [Gammaproteobacteria bacterium]|jgi:steroid delta-isomerase-like uncharacterized protein|nr:ester cyclase [Gammaproteobacteria bacterium]